MAPNSCDLQIHRLRNLQGHSGRIPDVGQPAERFDARLPVPGRQLLSDASGLAGQLRRVEFASGGSDARMGDRSRPRASIQPVDFLD
jgi:hypothetical protein